MLPRLPATAGRGGDEPPALRVAPDQRGDERGGVEPGPAQPVDRPVVGDERRGLGVPDERVLLDPRRHGCPDATCRSPPTRALGAARTPSAAASTRPATPPRAAPA